MKIKTAELPVPALDWAVAKCEGPNSVAACYYVDDLPVYLDEAPTPEWKPSTDWAQGGPIIEREGISLEWSGWGGDEQWIAYLKHDDEFKGPTPLIAAMRCYVASKLGEEIDIPEELG